MEASKIKNQISYNSQNNYSVKFNKMELVVSLNVEDTRTQFNNILDKHKEQSNCMK